MNTQNKIALVTGGSRGLGRAMAEALAKKGLDVIITYNSNEAATAEVITAIKGEGRQGKAFQLDASNTASFPAFLEKMNEYLQERGGQLDFLINNAGTALYAPATETTEEQMDEIYNIHFKGVFFLTQKVLPMMNDGGGIINISSGLARMTAPGSSVYASIKAAVETYTRYLAKELGDRRIRANVVAPGAIETDFGGGRVRDNKHINEMVATNTALGRAGLPNDIGGVIAFLCTDDAYWINAQRIEVSGGLML